MTPRTVPERHDSQSANGKLVSAEKQVHPSPIKVDVRKKLLFTAVILAATFGVPEALVRFLAPEYAHMRFGPGVTGSYPVGDRGGASQAEWLSKPRESNRIRIAMLGDSVMWGYALPMEQTIPVLVQQQLQECRSDLKWRTFNVAGIGHAPSLQRKYIIDNIDRWQMDAIIYQFHLNDVAVEAKKLETLRREADHLFADNAAVLRIRYLAHSALFSFTQHQMRRIYYSTRPLSSPEAMDLAAVADSEEIRQRWDIQFQAMADVKAACDRRHIQFRVYLWPTMEFISDHPRDNLFRVNRSEFQADPFKRFDEYLAKYGLKGRHLLEIVRNERRAMMAGEVPYDRLYYLADTNHPNQRGAEVFAAEIAKDILSGNVLKLPPPPKAGSR